MGNQQSTWWNWVKQHDLSTFEDEISVEDEEAFTEIKTQSWKCNTQLLLIQPWLTWKCTNIQKNKKERYKIYIEYVCEHKYIFEYWVPYSHCTCIVYN